ncbi:hypothetical protein EVU96_19970 [Bacillus infantis]|uniref:hypothetical protein n=1 Tax=Bacillus infantis TaxID=324767 RepID=UPI00101CC488|nr:hypothetical protein [Bacillus infantis]RYI26644.1 hypothetical protein EVU96_19970 [Bacillus infantis]
MNFTLFEVDNPKRLKKLSVNKVNFFKKHEDIELFHFNEIEQEMFHIVYHIKDEYLVGTKRVGNQMNLPFTQFINCFFFLESNHFLVEEVLEEYQKDVTLHIQQKANVTIQRKDIINDHFLSIYTSLSGFIKKLEYIDEDENDFNLDSVGNEKFRKIINQYKVDRLTMSVDEQFVSIYSKGRISVDNSDENYLIKFTRKIINAIDNCN